jgi:hypothetical protein
VGDESFYGPALSVQDTRTQFGDAANGDPINGGGGSEIDQVFGAISGGRLYLLVTGNLEPNFNKLEVFIDSVAGGVNQIVGANLPTGVDGFCCGIVDPNVPITSGALQRMNGLTFDAGFDADYYLTFTHGFENVNARDQAGGAVDPDENRVGFWAMSAHYAELGEGTAGDVVAAGIQYAQRGLPNVLRFPFDHNKDGSINAADYVLWRNTEGGTDGPADGNNDGIIDDTDYNNWAINFGTSTGLDGPTFEPQGAFSTVSDKLVGPAIPGQSQGGLVDRDLVMTSGGCTDDEGNGCLAEEFEFVLDVAPDETNNGSNHRLFQNTIDLQMALDNSNIEGVTGAGSAPWSLDPADDPQNVLTGIEFSIPLEFLGNPAGNIRVTAFVNGGGHDFLSNQFAGDGLFDEGDPDGLPEGNLGQNVLGDAPLATLADITGDQFVTIVQAVPGSSAVVPEPASLTMLGLVLSGLLAARMRR